jgi:NH3-dependent NAD+ synthetase
MRKEKFWVCGTRNKSEDILFNYSNASTLASLQPLIHLYKSEVLQIAEFLNTPKLAIDKSCQVDCVCGREALRAQHPRELDLILMALEGELHKDYLNNIPKDLKERLYKYINERLIKGDYKIKIPYKPPAPTPTPWSRLLKMGPLI